MVMKYRLKRRHWFSGPIECVGDGGVSIHFEGNKIVETGTVSFDQCCDVLERSPDGLQADFTLTVRRNRAKGASVNPTLTPVERKPEPKKAAPKKAAPKDAKADDDKDAKGGAKAKVDERGGETDDKAAKGSSGDDTKGAGAKG
jgi:hypothetical protein